MRMDHQEIEWQYDAPGGLKKVEEWLDGPQAYGLTVLKRSSKELVDTYYDTEDWRLYRAGYALRVRRDSSSKGSEATMKTLVPAEGNLHRRREISEPLKSGEHGMLLTAPGPVGARLRALAGVREIRPIFRVRTRRQTFDLLLDEQIAVPEKPKTGRSTVRIGEVALDSSEIPLGDGDESLRLTRVEVEADASAMTSYSALEGFVKTMERTLRLRPTAVSKYEAGLWATGLNPEGGPRVEVDGESGKKE